MMEIGTGTWIRAGTIRLHHVRQENIAIEIEVASETRASSSPKGEELCQKWNLKKQERFLPKTLQMAKSRT